MSSESEVKIKELNELVKRTNLFKKYPQISILKDIQNNLDSKKDN